ncbi:hypothetical protein, partial [Streptomyces sp. NPDC051173]|uniref:hypothetical protein n=1 Tax=Streptomyces sp. NPDC051173 TaxID=3155164 RepID=UPI00344CD864
MPDSIRTKHTSLSLWEAKTPISSAETLLIKSVKPESEKLEGETPLQQGAGNGIRTDCFFWKRGARKTDLVRLE